MESVAIDSTAKPLIKPKHKSKKKHTEKQARVFKQNMPVEEDKDAEEQELERLIFYEDSKILGFFSSKPKKMKRHSRSEDEPIVEILPSKDEAPVGSNEVMQDESKTTVVDDATSETVAKPSKSKKKKKMPNRKAFYESIFKRNVLGETDKDVEEQQLENLVFGGETEILEHLSSSKSKKKIHKNIEETDDVKNVSQSKEDSNATSTKRHIDDEHFTVGDKIKTYDKVHRSVALKKDQSYKEFAREKFLQIHGKPAWAQLDKKGKTADSDEESEEELLQKAGNYVLKSGSLPQKILDLRKCPDMAKQHGIIKSVEFHPSSKVALVGGLSGTVTLFQVDGKTNAKIQSVHFERFPISMAHFTMCGTELVAGSKDCAHFYTYDMMEGKISKVPCEKGMEQANFQRFHMSPDGKYIVVHGRYGNIHLLSTRTKEWIHSMKMNGEVVAITFNKSGSTMYSFGTTGEVYVWDMESRQCIHKFIDEGCIVGTSIAMSPNGQYLACGSDTGVVNVYENSSIGWSLNPKPVKSIMNLVTEVTGLKFNHCSELMVASSYLKPNALKLVHFPSMTVFSNFPIQERPLGTITSTDISANSGFLALGSTRGTVYLYRLRHFSNY